MTNTRYIHFAGSFRGFTTDPGCLSMALKGLMGSKLRILYILAGYLYRKILLLWKAKWTLPGD